MRLFRELILVFFSFLDPVKGVRRTWNHCMGSLRIRVAGGYVLECLRHLPNPPRIASWCGVGFFNRSFDNSSGRAFSESYPRYSPASLYIDKNRPRTGSRYGVDFHALRTQHKDYSPREILTISSRSTTFTRARGSPAASLDAAPSAFSWSSRRCQPSQVVYLMPLESR